MYEGAFIPGLVLAGLYAVYVFIVTVLFPKSTPGLPAEAQRISEAPERFLQQSLFAAIGLFAACALIPFIGQIVVSLYNGIAPQASLPPLEPAREEILVQILQVLAFIVFLYSLIKSGPKALGGNARLNLLGLTAIAGIAAVFIMMRTEVKAGADFVVLTMFIGIMIAFAAAVLNWICDRALGFRFLSHMAEQVTFVMVPPLFLIFLVLGTIFIGLATPTEGGAMGATGALILAAMKGRLRLDLVRQAVQSTAKLSAFVVFILIGARVFSLTFYGVDGHRWVENLLVSLPGGQIGFLVFVNAFVFVLAFFLDFFELAFIVIPLLGPAAEKLGIDLIWFGVMLGVNMQTSFMHPPFGFALFYLRSVAPKEPYADRVTGKLTQPVTTGQIYWGAIPFVIIQLIGVAAVIAFPSMVMHYKGSGPQVDPSKVNIEIQLPDVLPPLDLK
jgi:TRAP-type mannitol/chloroaromatic compound transport system permease large subunit